MLRYVISILCIATSLRSIIAQQCSIPLPTKEDDRNQPIILRNGKSGYELVIPERSSISLRGGDSLHLFCPSTRNKLQQSNEVLTTATCIRGKTFSIFNQQYGFEDLKCSAPPKGTVLETTSECGSGRGHKIDIGFRIQNDWITLIQICYDSNDGNALYAEHTVYGNAMKSASKQTYRPSFQNDGVAEGLSANNAYKQTNQKRVFAELLGSPKLVEQYVHKNSFLTRGHLAPDADFLFAGLQFTTYFYINTCPQWDAVNGGNWLGIEHMVRKFADKYQRPLRIITGSYDVLQLPDVNGNPRYIHLANEKLPVPKFLWKIIYDPAEKESIAFVAINDPFIKSLTAEELLCPDVCNTYGWNSKSWTNMKKGFVYCCEVNVLKRLIRTIPKLSIRDTLRGLS